MRARDAWLRQGALLASACALMLAVGLAASAASPAFVTLEVGREVGPGRYRIPFEDVDGENRALVFTVPAGIRIKAQGVSMGGSCMTEFCPLPGMMFEGEGDTGDDKGFVFCLDFETGADCGSGYPVARRAGDTTDMYGNPPGASASRAARAAKYGSVIDRIVASAHIEGAKRDATQRGGRAVATRCTEATLGGSRARHAALAVDCDALLAARHTLAGEGALNWSADTALVEWDGVTVAGAPPRVVGLDLRARGLSGSIPTDLGRLTALTVLDLSDNALTGRLSLAGSLPMGVRELPPTLATLRLAGNPFTGCIDERLRLAATNDLATLIKARGLSWCPVAEMPARTALSARTYQIDGNVIVDIPEMSPRVMWSAIEGYDADSGPGLLYCLSDSSEREEMCLDAYTGREAGRGMVDKYRRGGGAAAAASETTSGDSEETTSPDSSLNAVFDKIAASARPAPEDAGYDAPMSISPNGTPVGPGTYVIEGVIFDVPDGARISVPYIEVQDCPDEVVCGPLIIIDDEHSESSLALEIETGVENYRIVLPGNDAGSANALFDHIANSARPATARPVPPIP